MYYYVRMKRCHRCGVTKLLAEFHVNQIRRDGVQTYCKLCRSDLDHQRYERRRGTPAPRRQTGGQLRTRQWLIDLKTGRACTDCRRVYPPAAMQWDHLPGRVKLGDVSALCALSREVILAEIAKCELVCVNCHTMRTAVRAGWISSGRQVQEFAGAYRTHGGI